MVRYQRLLRHATCFYRMPLALRQETVNLHDFLSPRKKSTQPRNFKPWRALIAYWILGLCNNYGYVVMLSAANDILHHQEELQTEKFESLNNTVIGNPERQCNYISTGAILLADILPALIIKMISPFLPFMIHLRVAVCIILASGGFLLVAFSAASWMSILGVVCQSLSSGLGEVSFLQYSSFYNKNVVSTWSSGTGGAGIAGAFSYAALNTLGLQNALLIMLVVPLMMGVFFWGILPAPSDVTVMGGEKSEDPIPKLTVSQKFHLMPGLLKYMIPLGMVYMFEYFINQGMFELINFEAIFIDKAEQYRWLQVDYQLGVFISRSSVNLLHIKKIWILAVLQLINAILFTTEALYYYIPSFYILLVLTLWEGLLGGAAYVNTFYRISQEVIDEHKQFSLGTCSFADSIGISIAGALAIVAHNGICQLPKPARLPL